VALRYDLDRRFWTRSTTDRGIRIVRYFRFPWPFDPKITTPGSFSNICRVQSTERFQSAATSATVSNGSGRDGFFTGVSIKPFNHSTFS